MLFDAAILVSGVLRRRTSLNLSAVTIEGALQLGWQAGHLHWKVRTEKHKLVVALEGPVDDYLKRIEALVEAGHVRVVS